MKLEDTVLSEITSQVALVVKSATSTNAGNKSDMGSIPGSGRSHAEGNDNTHAWRISWTEEPGRLQSIRSPRVGHD